ncbi:MAG: bacillithiol biosynthesis cysteine-adding enzyme BshC [Candidatus Zixiibacteriota bacterium]
MDTLVTPAKSLGYSNIYLDFISDINSAKSLYYSRDLHQIADALDQRKYDRDELAQILTRQNKTFNASNLTFSNIEKLKQPRALTVFSGQQAILFGGPMLIMIKAIALVKTADEYSQKLNRPIVPIFWIAGDDHDFDEANHTTLLNRQAEEVTVSYNARPSLELPISEVIFENNHELSLAKQKYKEALGESEFTGKLYELLETSYRSGESFVTAFGKLLAGLTADFGLVLFNPGDNEVKKHAAGFFAQLINSQKELHRLTNSANKKILEQGYHLQVEKDKDSSHLFLNLDGRKPLLQDVQGFRAGVKSFSKSGLLKLADTEPEKFSPDVLTRPVFQSYLFPVLSQRGGPAEIAYLAQSAPIFELFDLPVPFYRNRPSVTFVEKHFEKTMDEYSIKFEDLTGDIEQVINRVLSKSFPEDIEKDITSRRVRIAAEFKELKEKSLRFDMTLKDFADQTYGKIDFALKNFEAKVFSSHKKKSQDVRSRIYRLWHSLYPARKLQERSINVGYFISKYGFNFIKFMNERIDINEKAHQLITLSEYGNK